MPLWQAHQMDAPERANQRPPHLVEHLQQRVRARDHLELEAVAGDPERLLRDGRARRNQIGVRRIDQLREDGMAGAGPADGWRDVGSA